MRRRSHDRVAERVTIVIRPAERERPRRAETSRDLLRVGHWWPVATAFDHHRAEGGGGAVVTLVGMKVVVTQHRLVPEAGIQDGIVRDIQPQEIDSWVFEGGH